MTGESMVTIDGVKFIRRCGGRRRGQVCKPIADDRVADSMEAVLRRLTALDAASPEIAPAVIYMNRMIAYVRDPEVRKKHASRSAGVQQSKKKSKEK